MTGCGASIPKGAQFNECGIRYGSTSVYPQSTTGNISGVFDTSGGVMEYVMGNYNNMVGNSGFDSMPERKYYNLYTFTDIQTMKECSLEECGGHGLNEIYSKYGNLSNDIYGISLNNYHQSLHGDSASYVGTNSQWYIRGGDYKSSYSESYGDGNGGDTYVETYKDGMFHAANGTGKYASGRGFRTTIINGFGD